MKNIMVKANGVNVRIYVRSRTKRGATYKQFDVVDYVDGRRKFVTFGSEKDARAHAKDIADRKAPPEFGVVKLVGPERDVYLSAKTAADEIGVRLDVAAIEYAEIKRRLGNVSPMEAIGYYLKHNPTTRPTVSVLQAKEEFIKAKTADKVSKVYLKDLEFRLGKFAESFNMPVGSIDVVQINAFLRGLDCAPRSRNNFRLSITTLIKFCVASGWIHKDSIDTKMIATAKEKEEEIEIFTVQEIAKLIIAAKLPAKPGVNRRYADGQGLLPLLVLGAFAGLRTAEIERQRWEDILMDRGFIRVTGAKGNTAQKRLVPISDNLKQWLLTCRKSSGLVCDIARTPDAIRRLAERAGVKWKHNALRHSFISYRCAKTQNVAQTSLEAGNSPKMVHRHYREVVEPEQAEKWFNITPANAFELSLESQAA